MALQAAEADCLERGEVMGYTVFADAAIAAHLAYLAETGHVVIKLPEPEGMDEDGQIWFDATEIRVDTTGSEPEIYLGRNQRTVEWIRQEAAELLSIAALVDAAKAEASE